MFSAGDYNATQEIYRGGKSLIYRGKRQKDNLPVILKVLNQDSPSAEERARFKTEYFFTQKVEGKGIIGVHDLLELQRTLAIVVEDFGGVSLSERLRQGSLSLEDFLETAIKITKSLAAIHEQNVLHKDINPSNIIVNPDDKRLKIIDFGISTKLPKESPLAKSPSTLEGTLPYISPEQTGRMNRSLDYRTDLYSLGITFYEMLMGFRPFQSQDQMELIHCHLAKAPRPPIELNDKIPKILSDLILKLLEKNAEDRYQTSRGLIKDLQRCKELLKPNGTIQNFELAHFDASGKFQIPEKLYGRGKEIESLLNAFENVSGGAKELILVKGFSGIGKTALVNEIQKPIARQRGYFISGKFDQFQRTVPYISLIEAFSSMVRQILSESEEEVNLWKNKLSEVLSQNGQIIIDVIPEVEHVIGKQPPVAELGPKETQNRFLVVFKNFMRVFARREHPVALFLDDLQWADLGTLQLIEAFMTDLRAESLLIIGGYRDNEVGAGHPLLLTLEELKARQSRISEISVKALNLNNCQKLISDALSFEEEGVLGLAQLCQEKTAGNPFFLGQFLKSLYQKKALKFDFSKGHWTWDLAEIKNLGMTDNVLELMAEKLRDLSQTSREILKLGACVGNHFSLHILAIVYRRDLKETAADLEESIKAGLILPMGEAYKYLKELDEIGEDQLIRYRFLHDRVQQAAYAQLNDEERAKSHQKIGQLLLEKLNDIEKEEKIVEIVSHLNLGISLLENVSGKETLAKLNLKAAQKSENAAAYGAVLNFALYAKKLLGPKLWESHYSESLKLHNLALEATFLKGEYQKIDDSLKPILENAKDNLDKVDAFCIEIKSLYAQKKVHDSVDKTIKYLRYFGISLNKNVSLVYFIYQYRKTEKLLKSLKSLNEFPSMQNKEAIAAEKIAFTGAGSMLGMENSRYLGILIFKVIQLNIQFGLKPSISFWVSALASSSIDLGSVLASSFLNFGFFQKGRNYAALSLKISEELKNQSFYGRSLVNEVIFIHHWHQPLKSGLATLKKSFKVLSNTGDLDFSSRAFLCYSLTSFFSGDSLNNSLKEIKKYSDAIKELKQGQLHLVSLIILQGNQNFISKKLNSDTIFGDYFNSKEEAVLLSSKDSMSIMHFYSLKLQEAYFFNSKRDLLEIIEKGKRHIHSVIGAYIKVVFYFYASLASFLLESDLKKIKNLKKTLKKWKKWAQFCPENFLNKYQLIEAEHAKALGKSQKAEELYDLSIENAKKNEFLQEEALANELAAKYFISKGRLKVARAYLEEAQFCYQKWGALAKIEHLNQSYPELLGMRLGHADFKKGDLSTTSHQINLVKRESTSTTNSGQTMDLATIVKFTRSISSEIDLGQLLKIMIHFALENAGAEKGVLVLKNKDSGRLKIEAEANLSSETKVLQNIKLEDFEAIPEPMIRYVFRTRELLLLDDAVHKGNYINNPYIQREKPKSVICLPILNKGLCSGILYLENNVTTGAFTSDRVEVLSVLGAQAAVSIENALLYESLKKSLKEESKLKDSFKRFVPEKFLELLQKRSITEVELGDHVEMEMTVLFSDIRGFTKLSEKMSPKENFNFINQYLGHMEPIIQKYGGFIDKYIGDAVMALFDGSSDGALKAALEMQKALRDFNQERASQNQRSIKIGIGLHTGKLMLGTIGGAGRIEGTVISDAVNTASRIENLSKEYECDLILSEDCQNSLSNKEDFKLEILGDVQIKGKSKSLKIFKVINSG